jgi:hypothetical protein
MTRLLLVLTLYLASCVPSHADALWHCLSKTASEEAIVLQTQGTSITIYDSAGNKKFSRRFVERYEEGPYVGRSFNSDKYLLVFGYEEDGTDSPKFWFFMVYNHETADTTVWACK